MSPSRQDEPSTLRELLDSLYTGEWMVIWAVLIILCVAFHAIGGFSAIGHAVTGLVEMVTGIITVIAIMCTFPPVLICFVIMLVCFGGAAGQSDHRRQ